MRLCVVDKGFTWAPGGLTDSPSSSESLPLWGALGCPPSHYSSSADISTWRQKSKPVQVVVRVWCFSVLIVTYKIGK